MVQRFAFLLIVQHDRMGKPSRYNGAMEDQDDCVPQDEQAIRDRIDDEIVNHDLLERLMPDDELVRSSPTITKRHTS
jgi:hypothetical protein